MEITLEIRLTENEIWSVQDTTVNVEVFASDTIKFLMKQAIILFSCIKQ